MIQLTRINHVPLVVNSDLIEHLEATPDTVISMTTGQKFMVLESASEVIYRVIEFRRSICEGMTVCSGRLCTSSVARQTTDRDSCA